MNPSYAVDEATGTLTLTGTGTLTQDDIASTIQTMLGDARIQEAKEVSPISILFRIAEALGTPASVILAEAEKEIRTKT